MKKYQIGRYLIPMHCMQEENTMKNRKTKQLKKNALT